MQRPFRHGHFPGDGFERRIALLQGFVDRAGNIVQIIVFNLVAGEPGKRRLLNQRIEMLLRPQRRNIHHLERNADPVLLTAELDVSSQDPVIGFDLAGLALREFEGQIHFPSVQHVTEAACRKRHCLCRHLNMRTVEIAYVPGQIAFSVLVVERNLRDV